MALIVFMVIGGNNPVPNIEYN